MGEPADRPIQTSTWTTTATELALSNNRLLRVEMTHWPGGKALVQIRNDGDSQKYAATRQRIREFAEAIIRSVDAIEQEARDE